MTDRLSAVALLTDGLETCLTASKRPRFGWQLVGGTGGDPSAGYQSAYQLRLSDAAGMLLWDSGVVPSRKQQFVVYGGPDDGHPASSPSTSASASTSTSTSTEFLSR